MIPFKTLKQWFEIKAYLKKPPSNDKGIRPDPLPSHLVWMMSRLSFRNKNATADSMKIIEKYFCDHFDQALNLFNRLLTYDWIKIRHVALDGMILLGKQAAQPGTDGEFREKTTGIMIEMARNPDFIVRETALKALKPLSETGSSSSAILSVAAELLSDETIYVAEDARDFLLAHGESGIKWFIGVLKDGNPEERIRALYGLESLSKNDPGLVTPEALNTAADLILTHDSQTAYHAAVVTLNLLKAASCDTADIKNTLPDKLEQALPGFMDQLKNEEAWWRDKVAQNIARFYPYAPAMLQTLIRTISTDQKYTSIDQKYMLEGVLRTLEKIGEKAADALNPLEKLLEENRSDLVVFRAAAAYEAVSKSDIPENLIPIVRNSFRAIFFKTHNSDEVPTAVRFSSNQPLSGRLIKSEDRYFLSLPMVSLDELDYYRWIGLEGVELKIEDTMIDKEVELTGIYHPGIYHKIHVESITLRGKAITLQ